MNRTFAGYSREQAGITAEIESRKPLFDKCSFNSVTFNKMFEQHKSINEVNNGIIPEPLMDSRSMCGYSGITDEFMNANIVSSIPYADINIYDNMKLKDKYTKDDFKKAKNIILNQPKPLTPTEIRDKINKHKLETNIMPGIPQFNKTEDINHNLPDETECDEITLLITKIAQLKQYVIELERSKDAEILRLNKIINGLIDKDQPRRNKKQPI